MIANHAGAVIAWFPLQVAPGGWGAGADTPAYPSFVGKGSMPAKWQQWMPFQIDRFKASPSVRAMHPAARSGYLYLLACQWQSADCSIPSDPLTLAEMSELGDELWATHGPRILRKFEPVNGNGTLRNAVCYGEWVEAKRIFDARREAAERTNSARSPKHIYAQSPDGHRVEMPRSADTRTTVVPVDVSVDVSVPVNGDSGSELGLAAWLFEELNIPCGNPEVRIAADAIRKVAKEGGTAQDAANYLLEMGKIALANGESVDRFWFTSQRYRPQKPKKTRRSEIEAERAEMTRRAEADGDD
jgi:hypothetical protein